jgi:hypothetical protein
MRLVHALIAHVRNDYVKAKGLYGYLKRRLLEKGTWASIAGAVAGASTLRPPYRLIIALLPTPIEVVLRNDRWASPVSPAAARRASTSCWVQAPDAFRAGSGSRSRSPRLWSLPSSGTSTSCTLTTRRW